MFLDLELGVLSEPLSDRVWQRADILREVAMRMREYTAAGLRAGDRVFVHFSNNLEFFADLLAVWRLGACFVPIDQRLTAFEVETLAASAQPRLALVDRHTDAQVVASVGRFVECTIASDGVRAATGVADAVPQASRYPRMDDDALILFTSGSTGKPKGAVLTHRGLRARWLAQRQCLGVAPYARTLCFVSTNFSHGLINNALLPWFSGQHVLIAPPFDAHALMQLGRLLDEHRITYLSAVPSMWALIVKASKPPVGGTVRRAHSSSGPLSAHLWRQIQQWTGTNEVYNAWGTTELGGHCAGTSFDPVEPEEGLVGVPWGCVIRIARTSNPQTLFEPDVLCGAGEPGYVWAHTASLMRGYLDQPALTDEVVAAGWFVSGDIGLLDERARFYLKGREREEINKAGTKIYPSDVDAVVERHEAAIGVCTFGYPDALYGQNVAMAVVLRRDDAATIQSLHAWMKHHLAEFKMPTRWFVVDAIPTTSRGKVSRSAMVEACSQRIPLDLRRVLHESPQGEHE